MTWPDGVWRRLDGSCGFNSFSADTTVATPHGNVPISDIEVGDTVLAYHEALGEVGEYEVIDTISHIDSTIVHLTIDGELLETTLEHPFYTREGEWVAAGALDEGRLIRDVNIGLTNGLRQKGMCLGPWSLKIKLASES